MTLQNAFEDLATAAKQDTGNTSLAAIVAALGTLLTELQQKLEPGDLAALSTAARQDAAAAKLDSIITGLTSIFGAVDGLEGYTDGLEAALATLNGKDFATQTTAAAILAKLSADPATQTTAEAIRLLLAGTLTVGLPTGAATSAKQDTQATKLDTLHTDLTTLQGYVDGLEGFTDGIEGLLATLTGKDYATQTTLAAVLAKLSADPATQTTLAAVLTALQGTLTVGLPTGAATAAKQDTQATKLDTIHTDLGTLATAAAQTTAAGKLDTLHTDLGTLNAKDFSTETTLAALSAKYPAVAALADAVANPSLTRVANFLHGYNGTTWDRLRSDTTNGLDVDPTRMPPDATATGSLSATGSVTLALAGLGGRSLYAVAATGTYTGVTFTNEVSFDGGTSYQVLPVIRSDSIGANPAAPSQTIAGTNMWFLAPLPAGATHVRARVTAIASGTVVLSVAAGVSSMMPWSSITGSSAALTLAAGTSVVGAAFVPGRWQDESTTPLAAAGTFTGTAYDLTAAASGTSFGNALAFAREFRASAIADVAGTLYLEVSKDNSTFYRVKAVALTQADGTSRYHAEIVHRPSARYARLVFVNGAVSQGVFSAQTLRVG